MGSFLCCSVKERGKPFVRDRHTDTGTDTGTNSQDSFQAGKDSDSHNRQTRRAEDTGRVSREFKSGLNDAKRKNLLGLIP